jgi:hypothetical protein
VFPLFEKNNPFPKPNICDVLFGDEPLEKAATYAEKSSSASPWSYFASAQQTLKQGEKSRAIDELRKILEIKGLESRVYLQAWHCLRMLGEFPPAEVATKIQGVVVEVAPD